MAQKITDRVKTFEDACDVLDIKPASACSGIIDGVLKQDSKSILAYCKLIIIARALNEGWIPDWNNENEYKYFPYFKMKSGFGFSASHFGRWHSNSGVGSRLCFRTRELAEYAGKQFEDIYNEFLNL